jgi:ATP-dependent DNA ligase
MLAGTPETLTNLAYPVLASPKYDGIRCLVVGDMAMSRSMKPIPNRHIAKTIKESGITGLDGELIVKGTFQDVASAVMSEDGTPDFEFHVFDTFLIPSLPFSDRIKAVEALVKQARLPWLKAVRHVQIKSAEQLITYEKTTVEVEGFEGVMLRKVDGPYKFGRSSAREGYLLKVKRWTTEEAVVTGCEEQETNLNVATKDELGRTKRSSHKAGKKLAGVLGTLVGRSEKWGEIRAGSGFTYEQRVALWNDRKKLPGRIFTFKYVRAGVKDAPRFPIFVGFRDPRDMGRE